MSHGDEAEEIPSGFKIIGHTENSHAAAIANTNRTVFGIQFHPEVVHTEQGTEILKNFVLKVCGAKQNSLKFQYLVLYELLLDEIEFHTLIFHLMQLQQLLLLRCDQLF
jgi:hypothetical protein